MPLKIVEPDPARPERPERPLHNWAELRSRMTPARRARLDRDIERALSTLGEGSIPDDVA